MNVLLAPLLAAPMTEAVISVFVIVIALKLAFFTIKKVAINVALGIVTVSFKHLTPPTGGPVVVFVVPLSLQKKKS